MIRAEKNKYSCGVQIDGDADTLRHEFTAIVKGFCCALADHTDNQVTAITLIISLVAEALIEMDSVETDEDDDPADMIREAMRKEHEE